MTLQPSQIDMHYEKTVFECGINQFLLCQFLDRPIVTTYGVRQPIIQDMVIPPSTAI